MDGNNFCLSSFRNNNSSNNNFEHDKIAGLYNIGQTIGKGHYAVVKEAKHAFTGEKVAIKVIDKTKLEPQSREHLYSEVMCMKLVQHPNVVRLYEVIDTAHKLYLVLELGDGGDLYDYIMKFEHGLPEQKAQRYFRQIVRAIAYCHNLHVVHRDLKPENVVFFEKVELVKLTDFGFSNKFTPGKTLETSCGSLAYSAPEILLGDAYDAPKVDIWSLGVILFMLVCGRLPFEEANDSETLSRIMDCRYELPGHLSDDCKRLIGKMLVRRPEDRSSLDEILSDFWLRSGGDSCDPGTRLDSFSVPLISQELLTVEEHLEILTKMSEGNLASVDEIQSVLDRDEYSYISATYFLLAERKLKRRYLENYCKMKLLEIETAESEPPPLPPAPSLPGTTGTGTDEKSNSPAVEFPVESSEDRIRRFSMILEDEEDEAEEEELEAMMSLASVREELETAPQRQQEPSAPFPSRCCSRLSDSIDPGLPDHQHESALHSSDFGRSSAFRVASYSRNNSNPPVNSNSRCRSAIFSRRSQIYSSHSLSSIPSLSRLASDEPGNSNNNNPLILSIKSPHKSSRPKLSSLLSPMTAATGFNPPSSSIVVPRFHRLNFSRRTSSICSCFIATVATNRSLSTSSSTNHRQSMSFDDNFHYMNCRYLHRPSLPNPAASSSTPSYHHGNNITRKRCSYPALFSLHPASASATTGTGQHLPAVVNSNNSHSSSDVSDTEVAIWRGFTERKPTVVPKSFGKHFLSSISNSSIDSDGGGSAYGGAVATQKLIPNCRRLRMKSGRSRPSSMGATMGSRLEDFQSLLGAAGSSTSGTVTAASTVTIIDPPGAGMMSAGATLQTTVSSSPTAVSSIAPHRDIYAPIHEEDELIRSRSYIDSNHCDSRSISHRLVSLDYRGRRQSESADTTPAKWLPWGIERQAPRACKRSGCSAPAGTPTVIGACQVPGTTPANRHSRSLSSQLTQSNFSLSSFASSLRDSKAMMNLVRGAFELQCSANRSSSAASNRNARHPDACASATVSGRESRCEFASVTSLPLGNKLLHSPDDSESRMNYESIIEHEKQTIIDDNHRTVDHKQSTEKPLIPKQSICSNYSDPNAATTLIPGKSVNKSLSIINNNSNSSTNPFLRASSNMSRKARFILSCCRPS